MLGRAVEEMSLGVGVRQTGQAQKFSYPDNRCPPGYRQTGAGSDAPPRGYSPPWGSFVMCKPQPQNLAPAPVAPAPQINVQTTVSPTLQTDISPQISPIFAQMQDSPGSQQAATTAQTKPGGMTAKGGGTTSGDTPDNSAMMEFLRMQAEQDAARRFDDSASRERERQDRMAAEQRQSAQAAELQRIEQERRDAEAAGRSEQAAALQAQYEAQQREWAATQSQPGEFVSVAPGMVPLIGTGEPMSTPDAALIKPGLPMPLIVAAVAALVVGGYFYATNEPT